MREHAAGDDLLRQVGEGVLHELRLRRDQPDRTSGNSFREMSSVFSSSRGHSNRVGAGVLVDHEAHGRRCRRAATSVRGSALAGVTVAMSPSRDVLGHRTDRNAADVVGVAQFGEGAHREAELPAADGAAGGHRVGALDRGRDIVGGEAERANPLGVDIDADLVVRVAHHGHRWRPHRAAPAGARGHPAPRAPRRAGHRAGEGEHGDRPLARIGGEQRGARGRARQWLRALSSFSRTASTVFAMSVPHAKRSVVVPSPLRLDRAHLDHARACCRRPSRSVRR